MKSDTKTCPHCGDEFSRPAGITPSRFAPQKFCTKACYHDSRRKPDAFQRKICQYCGATIQVAPNRLAWNHNQRKYCDNTCYIKARYADGNGNSHLNGDAYPTDLPPDEREYLQQFRKRRFA